RHPGARRSGSQRRRAPCGALGAGARRRRGHAADRGPARLRPRLRTRRRPRRRLPCAPDPLVHDERKTTMTKPAPAPSGKPTDLRAAFGFHAAPFTREIATDHRLRWAFLDEALAGLQSAVEARMSAALIAAAGTGKTALLRRLRDALPEARYHVHYVKVTGLSKRDMCREIAVACGAQPAGSYPLLVRRLQERFEATAHQEGRRPVLLLDESHELRPDVLGMLRILTNFDMDSRLVLSLVIAGQTPLRTLLARDEHEAMARRIIHYAQLRLLSRDE